MPSRHDRQWPLRHRRINKDDEAYKHYRNQHRDVPEREREFLKTLIHFQTQNLQIFDKKQAYIKNLEDHLKAQEELKKELEEAKARELLLQQQVHQAEQTMQQILMQHQEEIRLRDEQLQNIKHHNDKLIQEKEQLTTTHIQEAYQTNLSLHRRTNELEKALQEAETLLRERTQLVRELEEVPKIPVSPDD